MTGNDSDTLSNAPAKTVVPEIRLDDRRVAELYEHIAHHKELSAELRSGAIIAASCVRGCWIEHEYTDTAAGKMLDPYWKPEFFNLTPEIEKRWRFRGNDIPKDDMVHILMNFARFFISKFYELMGQLIQSRVISANGASELIPRDVMASRMQVFSPFMGVGNNELMDESTLLEGLKLMREEVKGLLMRIQRKMPVSYVDMWMIMQGVILFGASCVPFYEVKQ